MRANPKQALTCTFDSGHLILGPQYMRSEDLLSEQEAPWGMVFQ